MRDILKRKAILEVFREDNWFCAVVLGETVLVVLGFVLPIVLPLVGGRHYLSLLLALTVFRIFFLWGIATQR